MEFPFGGHHNRPHHRHHHRNEEEEEEYPQPPPPPPPPPPSFGTTIESHQHYGPPPPNYMYEQDGMYQRPPPPNYMYEQDADMYQRPPPPNYMYEQDAGMYQGPPPPPPDFSGGYSSGVYSNSPVQHVSHELEEDPSEFRHHHHHHHHNPIDHTPPPTSFVYQHTHETDVDGGNELFFNNSNLPTVRVYSKAEPTYSLTIRDGRVILAPSDPTDVFQHWIKDEKYSVRVKDEEGFPSFSLVNKATGQAIKHSIGATHPVQLQPYNPDDLDASVLWTESRDLGDGFRTIRMINNIRLNLDAFNGDINHGGVHDGTTIVLWEWKKGDNQRWRIVRYCKSFNTPIQKGI